MHFPYDYVIGPEPDHRFPSSFPLGDLVLSTNIPTTQIGDWYLLGEVFPSSEYGARRAIPNATDDIYEECATWAGRWLLVSHDSVIPDGAAMLACYYSKNLAASHPALLTAAPSSDPKASLSGFIMPPMSGYNGIRKLLPSQILHSFKPAPRPWPAKAGSYQEILERVANRYRSILKGIYASHPTIWTALTAGIDSRLVLAASLSANVPVTTFTHIKPWPYMDPGDRLLPNRIAAHLNLEHKEIKQNGIDPARIECYRNALGQFSMKPGTLTFYGAHRYIDQIPKDSALLTGVCGELGRLYYGLNTPSIAPQTPDNKRGEKLLSQWWRSHPLPIEDSERLYWEARLAGWAQNTGRVADLIYEGRRRLLPLNCLDIYADILCLDHRYRRSGKYLKDLIDLMAPELSRFPFNPRPTFVRKALMKAGRIMSRRSETGGRFANSPVGS